MHFLVVLGDSCNMNCIYCYEKKRNKLTIKYEHIATVIDTIFTDKNILNIDTTEEVSLGFTGGEPLLYIGIIRQATERFLAKVLNMPYVNKDKIRIYILTNGVLVNTSVVQSYLTEYKDYINLVYSIDGIKESHNKTRIASSGEPTFDLILDNILNNSIAKVYEVRCVLSVDILQYTFEIIKFWVNLNLPITLNFPLYSSDKKLHIDTSILRQEYKKIVDWYTSQLTDWIINNRLNITNADYKAQFACDLLNSKLCIDKGFALDVDGAIMRCWHSSILSCKEHISKTLLGYADKIRDVKWDEVDKIYRFNDNLCTYRDPICYRCPIGSDCGHCDVLNYSVSGDYHKWNKDVCNLRAFFHLINCFCTNFWILTYLKHETKPDIKQLESGYYIFKGDKQIHVVDLLLPRVWASEVIGDTAYTELKEITEAVGGKINLIQTKYYTEEQINQLKNLLEG